MVISRHRSRMVLKRYLDQSQNSRDIENFMNDSHAPSTSSTRSPMDVDALVVTAVSEAKSRGKCEPSNGDNHEDREDQIKQLVAYEASAASKATTRFRTLRSGVHFRQVRPRRA